MTETGEICMQRVFGAPVNKSNKLNCTASDIQLSRAVAVYPETCIRGSTFDLTATFETKVTANARYDAAFYFRIDGEGTARGDGADAAGTCSISSLYSQAGPPMTALDADSCGDLNAGTYNLTFTIPDVYCDAAPGTDELRLPNCTAWHSNQGTVCDSKELVSLDLVGADAAAQLDFEPDTKSKCVCDDTFTVPVAVEEATIEVVKTAFPTEVPESGGWVTYTVEITNTSLVEPVFIYSIIDEPYGNLGNNDADVVDNECLKLIGTELQPGGSAKCSFKVFESGDTGDSVMDIVEACATQKDVPEGTPPRCASDDAVVTFYDVYTPPTLTKSVVGASCLVDVEYEVVVTNPSDLDTLTVNSLTDDRFGDVSATHGAVDGVEAVTKTNCPSQPVDVAPLGELRCRFTGQIASATCNLSHTNEVTSSMTDDDQHANALAAKATVSVSSSAP